ncbi:hypothetical protein CYLTODRAFT_106796 [Cylindrobasidium torrendii FP15055 ss-10]|uniref:Uncharacterized protein n=1 Tax=Cylindrobasidium torrendii FP15055 ss-10 TaxID=1314674 RepID=A0A0D7B1D9_9AGAR|nr:hypothetical protein CYLTODRAFT_106796 [Cylindrobasidium torrendii FP15055 ss-10]
MPAASDLRRSPSIHRHRPMDHPCEPLLELDMDSFTAPFELNLDYYFNSYAKPHIRDTSSYLSEDEDTDCSSAPSLSNSDCSDPEDVNTQYAEAWPVDSPNHTPSYLDVYPSLNASPISSSSSGTPERPPLPPTDIFTDLVLWACATPADLYTICEMPEPEEGTDGLAKMLSLFPAPPTFVPSSFAPQAHATRPPASGDLSSYDEALRASAVNEWLSVDLDPLDGHITLTTKRGRREIFVDAFDAFTSVEDWILRESFDVPEAVGSTRGRERWMIMREVAGCVRARIAHASRRG